MSRPEVHEINGTTFRFPELPPRSEIDPLLFDEQQNKRKAILAAALSPRVAVRNAGTVRVVLGKLAGSRELPKRPDHMRGEFTFDVLGEDGYTVLDTRTAHYWAAATERGTWWVIDLATRTYALIRERDLKYFAQRFVLVRFR